MTATRLEPPFALDTVPDRPAVFVVKVREGRPYVARTALLRRRLKRLLEPGGTGGRRLKLTDIATAVEYYPVASRLASSLLYYELAKQHFPEDYAQMIKLRPAPFVKVLLGNEFPRTAVTARLGGGAAFQYGPFRTRASAERFEQETLDLFQVRRCQEDLEVSPEHPGCIYGEMMKCLRPCQEVVGRDEYATEVGRLVSFLKSGGSSLLESVASARERCSEMLDFEEAARQHARYQRVEQALKTRDELASGIEELSGVVVAPSVEPGSVELLIMLGGVWLEPEEFRVAAVGGEAVSLDRRLRELMEGLRRPKVSTRQMGEHVALLARWFYGSWRDGDWLAFRRLEDVPYRRLVRAVSKVAAGTQAALFEQ